MNTIQLLTIASAIVPERAAIVFQGQEISLTALQARVNRLAHRGGGAPADHLPALYPFHRRALPALVARGRRWGFALERSVVFVDELPRNGLGKVLKRDLRLQYSHPMAAKD